MTSLDGIREFKIPRLRTTTTVKHATAHDQNHVRNILLVFCRLGNSRISSFRKKVFNSPALSEGEANYVSCA